MTSTRITVIVIAVATVVLGVGLVYGLYIEDQRRQSADTALDRKLGKLNDGAAEVREIFEDLRRSQP